MKTTKGTQPQTGRYGQFRISWLLLLLLILLVLAALALPGHAQVATQTEANPVIPHMICYNGILTSNSGQRSGIVGIPVEQEKNAREQGFYLHPELCGALEEKQIERARHPELMKQMKERRDKPQPAIRTDLPPVTASQATTMTLGEIPGVNSRVALTLRTIALQSQSSPDMQYRFDPIICGI